MSKHFFWNILSRRLASSPSRIFEVSLEFTRKVYQNTAAIFQYVPGKMIITRCSDLILHKIRVQYQKIWILKKVTFIQRHFHHACTLENSFDLYNFWHFLTVMQEQCWPEVRKLKNRARHYNLAKPWLNTSLEPSAMNFLCDLYGKMISDNQPNMFTCLRHVKQ